MDILKENYLFTSLELKIINDIINEIEALFHINSTIISHPHNDNICVTKNKAVFETRYFQICGRSRQ